MIDRFLHKLIDENTKADDQKIGFLDCLLLFCAVVFSVLIRLQLKEFSLAGYAGEEVSAGKLLYLQNVRLAEAAAILILAAGMFSVVFLSQKNIRRAGLSFAITLFLPSFIALGGMCGYADSYIVIFLFAAAVLWCCKKCLLPLIALAAAVCAGVGFSGYMAPPVRGMSIFEVIGYGTLAAEYAKAGAAVLLFFAGCLFFVRGREILSSARGRLVCLLCLLAASHLLLPRLPISVCLLAELLALYDGILRHKKIYRAVLLAGINFAVLYRQMLDTTFIPSYCFSFLLILLLLDLSWEIYLLGVVGGEPAAMSERRIGQMMIFLAFATALGAYLRIIFRHFESVDYRFCFKPWTDAFKLGGGFRAMAGDFYNYPPFYMYMMYLVSLLPMEPLYPLKMVSILWDVALSAGAGMTVRQITKSDKKGILTYALILCLPTVAVNSGLWAQCDVMYVCLIIWSLYFYAKERPRLSMLFYAGAFCFKMQVFFVLPVYVYLWTHKKYKLGQFLYLPGLYFVSCLPASLIGGKSLRELLLLYVGQSQQEPWMLSWYWPNIYQIFGVHEFYIFLAKAGMYGAIAVTMLLLYDMAKRLKDTSPRFVAVMMLAYALVIPYFLPYMHERYGYLADVLAVMIFVMLPRFLPVAMAEALISYAAYANHLHEEVLVPTWVYCIPMTLMVWYVVRAVYRYRETEEENQKFCKTM